MPQTLTQQLDEIQAAKTAILVRGQEYEIGGRSLKRADIRWVLNREKELITELARESRGGIRIRHGTAQR